MTLFATELATPSVTDVRTNVRSTDTLRRLIYKDDKGYESGLWLGLGLGHVAIAAPSYSGQEHAWSLST